MGAVMVTKTKTLHLLALTLALLSTMALVLGCSSDAAGSPDSAGDDHAPSGAAFAIPEDNAALGALAGGKRINVRGSVVAFDDVPRTVSIIDARGEYREALTDPEGVFSAANVVVPYDMRIGNSVFLGVRRSDPVLDLDAGLQSTSTSTALGPPQSLRVSVRACGAAGDEIRVLTVSPSGGGVAVFMCDSAMPGVAVTINVQHVWRGATADPREQVAVHVLANNASRTSLTYAYEIGFAGPENAGDDGVWTINVPAPTHIESMLVPVVARSDATVLREWEWSVDVLLRPDGLATASMNANVPAIAFGGISSPSGDVVLPCLPGWSLEAKATARHPRSESSGGFQRMVSGWSGDRSIETPDAAGMVVMNAALGPDILHPSVEGPLSRHARAAFTWTPAPKNRRMLATLVVSDTTRGKTRFRVMTNANDVRLAKLYALGIPKLEQGEHSLSLRTSPSIPMEDVVSPSLEARQRPYDSRRPGSTATLYVPFVVTE